MVTLGVNIDHVATLRQARGGLKPNPIMAAYICEQAGADSIVAHLREDRRHIQDSDIKKLKKAVQSFNLEMSLNPDIVRLALSLKPYQATLVPEKRKELTTEGGLDVVKYFYKIKPVVEQLQKNNIRASLFIDPKRQHILASKKTGAWAVEIHTGAYANAATSRHQNKELTVIREAVVYAKSLGLIVNAGHGLNYENVQAIANIPDIEELNIGHAIIARSVVTGLYSATQEMLQLIHPKRKR
jgi:pyridoxine 5-phosphate synthase